MTLDRRSLEICLTFLLVGLLHLPCALADEPDVVVIVDTSVTMTHKGMDPDRTSLLLTKLLTDIVPGKLSVIRLLDMRKDAPELLKLGQFTEVPCGDDPSVMCQVAQAPPGWIDTVSKKRLGALERPTRGDSAFKAALDGHLEQTQLFSQFSYSFLAAQGVFKAHEDAGFKASKRVVIWLSDGKDESGKNLAPALAQLRAQGVEITAIVFGRNSDPGIPRKHGLPVIQVTDAGELMNAFAQAFRGIVDAPYRIDNLIARAPEFRVHDNVEEIWVVVYGDSTLGDVTLTSPAGEFTANDASDIWQAAGAYRVARISAPAPGVWRVQASSGGSGAAYAVIQRSSLGPVLLEPMQAQPDTRVRLIGAVKAKHGNSIITDAEALRGMVYRAQIEGTTLVLRDDGRDADQTAGDGRFSGWYSFRKPGVTTLALQLESPQVKRSAAAKVTVSGIFLYIGAPISIDFGALKAPTTACQPVYFKAIHKGAVPFVLESLDSPPSGHEFFIRAGPEELHPGDQAKTLLPQTKLELCFTSGPRAPDSSSNNEPLLRLKVTDSQDPEHQVDLLLTWQLDGLSLWQRWGWLILLILGLLLAALLVLGFIVPKRFPRTLSLSFAPDISDLDDMPPLAIHTWRGVGIGFYRNARAYLHGDYRISGRGRGALASLHAEGNSARVRPGAGSAIFRRDINNDWEQVRDGGEPARAGDLYRIGDQGPYFRIALRVSSNR